MFAACVRDEAAILVVIHDAVIALAIGDEDVAGSHGRRAGCKGYSGAFRRLGSPLHVVSAFLRGIEDDDPDAKLS